jgi:hypothetical protein
MQHLHPQSLIGHDIAFPPLSSTSTAFACHNSMRRLQSFSSIYHLDSIQHVRLSAVQSKHVLLNEILVLLRGKAFLIEAGEQAESEAAGVIRQVPFTQLPASPTVFNNGRQQVMMWVLVLLAMLDTICLVFVSDLHSFPPAREDPP